MDSANLTAFRNALLESERQANRESPRFLEPVGGTLDQTKSKRNIIVFGRRGSGKTSLLAKAYKDLRRDHLTVWIDVEPYKQLRYPDVLLSFLRLLLSDLREQLPAQSPRTLTAILPFSRFRRNRRRAMALLDELKLFVETQLQLEDGHRQGIVARSKRSSSSSIASGLMAPGVAAAGRQTSTEENSQQVERAGAYDKLAVVQRARSDFHQLFQVISRDLGIQTYVFIDDLYHLPKGSQPQVVDFFQGLSKDAQVFVKIGTIRHRSEWYVHGAQPIGMKLGDDAASIDLDLSLEDFHTTQKFLVGVATAIGEDSGVDLKECVTDGAITRLAIGSGGVVRDYIALLRRAIERWQNAGTERVMTEHVNHAAANHEESKREELKKDVEGERERLEKEFELIREFCVGHRASNIFLMDLQERNTCADAINQLVDLRLLHKVGSSVSTTHKTGKRYTALMLDLSQCVKDERLIKGLELIEFWRGGEEKEKIRRVGSVYDIAWRDSPDRISASKNMKTVVPESQGVTATQHVLDSWTRPQE